jgi:hypothetical protein
MKSFSFLDIKYPPPMAPVDAMVSHAVESNAELPEVISYD